MRLGVNGWRLLARPTGVARYLANLLSRWRPGPVFSDITVYSPATLDRQALGLPHDIHIRSLPSSSRMLVWENLRFGPQAADDVLFCPAYSRPLVARGRTVVATHDMVYRVHPELFSHSVRWFYSSLYGWSDRHATLIVADSAAVKDEIVRYCRVPPSRVRVVYLAPAPCFEPLADAGQLARARVEQLGADVPFFLFVGKITGRRSVPHLLEAFAALKRRTALDHHLLLVGAGTDSAELTAMSDRLGIAAVVKHAGFLPDQTLNVIYNAATALVSAAVYETSSLPVMEAQATGLPVICLRNPGMDEITAGAALMIDRLDAATLGDAMIQVAGDEGLQARLRIAGLESARRFSWERCARETMTALEEAATMWTGASVSVVVTSCGAPALLRRCLAALVVQSAALEIIVVEGSAADPGEWVGREFPGVRVIHLRGGSVPELRWAGAREARGSMVAATESWMRPASDWCTRLADGHARWPDVPVVGGNVALEPGATALDTGFYLCEYGAFAAPVTSSSVQAVSSANLSYKRGALLAEADILDRGEWELPLHERWLRAGRTLGILPATVVFKNGLSGAAAVSMRYRYARRYAAERFPRSARVRRGIQAAGCVLLPAVMTWRQLRDASRSNHATDFGRSFGWVLLLNASWTLGECVGYLLGARRPALQPDHGTQAAR